jgi:hypothetical protein
MKGQRKRDATRFRFSETSATKTKSNPNVKKNQGLRTHEEIVSTQGLESLGCSQFSIDDHSGSVVT